MSMYQGYPWFPPEGESPECPSWVNVPMPSYVGIDKPVKPLPKGYKEGH